MVNAKQVELTALGLCIKFPDRYKSVRAAMKDARKLVLENRNA